MSSGRNFIGKTAAVSISIVFVCLVVLFSFCSKEEVPGITVAEAFELRMNGMVDSAKTGLESIIADDSTNAAAWFELARTKHYMGLGNPRNLYESLGDIEHAIEQAVAYDPENLIYAFYRGYFGYFNTYALVMGQQPGGPEKAKEAISAFEHVLELKPDYHEATLYLIEMFSAPEQMGLGDNSAKAESLAVLLEELDPVFGAKARDIRMPPEGDRIALWSELLSQNPDNPEVLEQLGKAYLYKDNLEPGKNHIEKALEADPERKYLILDLARYHLMNARSNPASKAEALELARDNISRYLATEPIAPLKAYALGLSSILESWGGSKEEGEKLREQATAIDPYFSKAFAVPPRILFSPPYELSHYHSYFLRPL